MSNFFAPNRMARVLTSAVLVAASAGIAGAQSTMQPAKPAHKASATAMTRDSVKHAKAQAPKAAAVAKSAAHDSTKAHESAMHKAPAPPVKAAAKKSPTQ